VHIASGQFARLKALFEPGLSVISVDANRKELVGSYKNNGRERLTLDYSNQGRASIANLLPAGVPMHFLQPFEGIGYRARFITASALVSELIEARDEKHLQRFQKQLASYELLIVDELGYVPLSKTGAELLFETFSQRYERTSSLITSNLPFEEWTEVFGSERLTGALLDRITLAFLGWTGLISSAESEGWTRA